MSSTFSIALSALQAQSEAINATGNNLANVNTDGFKGSAVDFKDLFSEYLGVDSGFSVGLGVGVPINNTQFSQGAIQTSTSPLATAIQGNGFFVVQSAAGQQLYTRDGNFTVNAGGQLQTQTGETIQGWLAGANGAINANTAPTDIVLPTGTVLPPQPTQNVSITANLNSTPSSSTTPNTFSTTVQVVDSLGNTHNLEIQFTQSTTTPSDWSYQVTLPSSDFATPTTTPLTTGTVSFDSNGNLTSPASTGSPIAITVPALADGATLGSGGSNVIDWNLYNNTTPLVTQYAQASGVSATSQDGSQASQLTSISIQNGGQVVASFSNGQQTIEAQLAMANIENPNSLQNAGNNNFAATNQTATPAIGLPQSGGRGAILGQALEASNVDLATQFTDLIEFQSAYQAASRVITTADQMNQDLLSLIHS